MKKRMIYLLMVLIFMMGLGIHTEVLAQRSQGDKKYWKQIEKAEKERAKYIRKQNKDRVKYYRDIRKQDDKFFKEAVKRQRKYYKAYRTNGPPPWANAHGYDARHHIYFRDYRTFYDPYRGGYVFVNGGNWSFSVDIPAFMVNVNLDNARTTVIRDIPVSRHPEDFYYDYVDDYVYD